MWEIRDDEERRWWTVSMATITGGYVITSDGGRDILPTSRLGKRLIEATKT